MRKPKKNATGRIITTGLLIVAIVLLFSGYTRNNEAYILQQSTSYMESTTEQTAAWIEDVLENACSSINNMAKLYGMTLTSDEVSPEDLKGMEDRSLFDYVDFVNADGMDISVQGVYTDVSDRSYFIKGMQGETGMDGTYTSKVTNERLVIFYAPVKYEGEIIGVLTGHYLEERMKKILRTEMLDEPVTTFLCLDDGTVVSSIEEEIAGEDVFSYFEGKVDGEERAGLESAIAGEENYVFTCEVGGRETAAYATSLPGNTWTLIQLFPTAALQKMQEEADASGLALEVELIILFAAFMVFWLLQEWYQKVFLMKEKREAEKIIAGINKLFTRFIKIDFKEATYEYVDGREPLINDLPKKGNYESLLATLNENMVVDEIFVPLGQVLREDKIKMTLTPEKPFEWYEYQMEGTQEEWHDMAVIALDRDEEGVPTSVLFAIQEVTERKREELQTQNALRAAVESAESANCAKSEFLSRMSHDIRTPMNAIIGMTSIAKIHINEKVRVLDCLEKITVSSKHLLGLINEVLDMSKIESGRLELTEEEFDLSEVVMELISLFQSQMDAKNHVFSAKTSGIMHEKVVGDEQRLSQVLVNIMGNAVKYTPQGGTISLEIREIPAQSAESACYEFTFQDNGIGMDSEFVDKIFEPFSRASEAQERKIEGTGLGMSIAKSIVQMMNGDIEVESAKGKGTQIKATVILRYASVEEEDLGMLEGQRVMVVDEEQTVCESTCEMLSSLKVSTDWFTDGEEAVRALLEDSEEEKQYAAVILDYKMPGKNGVELTREIREKMTENVPVIILSAYDWTVVEHEAREAGVNAFIAKPLFKSRLNYVMRSTLGRGETQNVAQDALMRETQFENKKLLLVEDNELNIEIAEEILSLAGFVVDKAYNGKEAVERLEESAPGTYAVVLMDIQMPIMNGYEAAKAVRASAREDLQDIPILAMTADAFSDDMQRAEAAGMNGHIAKPIDINKLIETLKSQVK